MKKHLEKLRNKPEHKKQKIVKTLAIITTLIIVIIWLILLAVNPKKETDKSLENNFFDGLNNLLNESVGEFDGIKEKYEERETFLDILNSSEYQDGLLGNPLEETETELEEQIEQEI